MGQLQLGQDIAHVRLHGLVADGQDFGDLVVGASKGELAQDFLIVSSLEKALQATAYKQKQPTTRGSARLPTLTDRLVACVP